MVGRNWEDEKVIAVMKIVDEALGPRGFGPGSWTYDSEESLKRERSQATGASRSDTKS